MVRVGLEVMLEQHLGELRGRSVGVLCHAASVDRELRHAVDRLLGAGVAVAALFGPEHGVDGTVQDMVGVRSERHPRWDLPVYSLYGSSIDTLSPDASALDGLDLIVVDLQDIGARYYTYVWTMLLTMQACARRGLELWVLDRPNPLGGAIVEGAGIAAGFESFVGMHSICTRHGLSCGELAELVRHELRIDLPLRVIKAEGWRRDMLFDETGLPWVLPSPNMPTLDTALVYPGGCLLEATNVSEGRGTTRPFELVGAPWVDGNELASALLGEALEGVVARPVSFRPTFQKYGHETCDGVQLHVTDRMRFRPLRTGVALLRCLRRGWPEHFAWRADPYEFVSDRPAIDLLAGGPGLREGLEGDVSLSELVSRWPDFERAFAERRRPHLMYV